MKKEPARARIKLSADQIPVKVAFEPTGMTFELLPGEKIFLDVPLSDLVALEICAWDGGIDVVLPDIGDHMILDSDGNRIVVI